MGVSRRGLHVGLPLARPLDDSGRRPYLWFRRLEQRLRAWFGPSCRPQDAVHVSPAKTALAKVLPMSELFGEGRSVGEFVDPWLGRWNALSGCQDEVVALGVGERCWFGRSQGPESLVGVPSAQFRVGGHG
jgi:hypothetical protein